MLYNSPATWEAALNKRILFFGMSGLGKTHLSNMLRASGDWFHYSIDYRIGTAYMGEHIKDNLKQEAMRVPFLANLLRTDSIYIGSNITFENLAPLSTYLGKPGNPDLGGLPFAEYARRQELHHRAERNALMDTSHFITRARALYGYTHFVCDSGGSICEVVNPDDPTDALLSELHRHTLMIWIEGSDVHRQTLIDRFRADPKPMCYRMQFLEKNWATYLQENGCTEDQVDPDDFMLFTYARAIDARQARYAAMARNWGIKVSAFDVATCRDAVDIIQMVTAALGKASAPT